MKILAFDTSTKYLSIACLEDNEVKSEFHEDAGIRHSEILIPTIEKQLNGLKWRLDQIGLICVGLGPGSFTGLRIAVATVKGLTAVLPDIKVAGVPTMDAIVANISDKAGRIAPFLDAHKQKVYSCIYEASGAKIKRISDYLLLTADELLGSLKKEVFFFGDAVERYKKKLDRCVLAQYTENMDWYPRAAEIGRIGLERSRTKVDDPESIEPLYLHAKEANIIEKRK